MDHHIPNHKIWVLIVFSFILGAFFSYWLMHSSPNKQRLGCDYRIARVDGYEWVKPILSAEKECESGIYEELKQRLSKQVDSLRQANMLLEASIYLRSFDRGEWMAYREDTRYHPASLMKVALLISVLKSAEVQPGLLQQRLVYVAPPEGTIQPQYYSFPSIEPGKEYTIAQLLEYMIVYSDNHATWLLASRLNPQSTPKLFADIGLNVLVEDKERFTMSVTEMGTLFKVIFNSSYLSPASSEYAARLMSRCAFAEGLRKGLPPNIRLWHKFGEWRYAGHPYELHEAGVFYIEDVPYLVVIMTRGTNTDRQAQSIALLTRTLYRYVLQQTSGAGLGWAEQQDSAP